MCPYKYFATSLSFDLLGKRVKGRDCAILKDDSKILQASNGTLKIAVSLPEKHHLTQGANSRYEVSSEQPGAIAFESADGPLREQSGNAVAEVQFRRSDAADAQLTAKVYYCLDGGVCLFQESVFRLEFLSDCKGRSDLDLNYRIPAKAPQGAF